MEKKKSIYSVASVRYGMTNFFSTLSSQMASSFFSIFITTSIGMSAMAMGSIMTIAGIVDTISIFVISVVIQKSQFKSGKFRPWLLAGGIVCAVFSWLRFTDFGLSGTSQFVYFLLTYIIAYMGFNFAYSSFLGVLPLLAKDPVQRVNFSSSRVQFNSLAKILFGLVSVSAIAALGYSGYTAILGVLIIVGFFQLYQFAKPYDIASSAHTKEEESTSAIEKVSLWDMFKQIVSAPWILWLISSLAKGITFFVVLSLAAYYYTYVIGNTMLLTFYLSASTIFMLVGSTLTPFIAKIVGGGKNTYLMGGIIFGGFMLLSYFARSSGIGFTILLCISYIGYSIMHASEVAMYSNIVDYTEYKTGKDMKGFLMSFMQISPKVSSIFQGIVLGAGLTIIGFNADNVTPQATNGLAILMSLLPAIILGVGVVCTIFFPLNDKKVLAMQEEIKARKAQKVESESK